MNLRRIALTPRLSVELWTDRTDAALEPRLRRVMVRGPGRLAGRAAGWPRLWPRRMRPSPLPGLISHGRRRRWLELFSGRRTAASARACRSTCSWPAYLLAVRLMNLRGRTAPMRRFNGGEFRAFGRSQNVRAAPRGGAPTPPRRRRRRRSASPSTRRLGRRPPSLGRMRRRAKTRRARDSAVRGRRDPRDPGGGGGPPRAANAPTATQKAPRSSLTLARRRALGSRRAATERSR